MTSGERTTPIVEFSSVSYSLGDGRRIISDLDLEVQSSETLVLLGRSGSGKTTTLKLINGLLEPTSGEVRVEGIATTGWEPTQLRRRIGYVIQEIGLFPHFTVTRNVGLVPTLEGWPEDRVHDRVEELMNLVALDPGEFGERLPSQLSGGQRQRVGVARALAADPPLLLLDEPFGALDPLTRVEMQRELLRVKSQLGKTVIFVTHDVREALALASRVALFSGGRLVWLGAPDQLRHADHPEAVAFASVLDGPGEASGEFAQRG